VSLTESLSDRVLTHDSQSSTDSGSRPLKVSKYDLMMLDVTLGIFAGLLLPTGWAKLRKPYETSRALRSVGWPGTRTIAFSLGLVEVTVSIWVLAIGSTLAVAAMGVLYAGFLVWLGVAFRAGGVVASCGCSATPDTPPTAAHVGVNAMAVTAVVLNLSSSQPGVATSASSIVGWLALVLVIVIGVWLALTVITSGARLTGIVKS
jgi:hypothetical protein